jgi:hypothetical protein
MIPVIKSEQTMLEQIERNYPSVSLMSFCLFFPILKCTKDSRDHYRFGKNSLSSSQETHSLATNQSQNCATVKTQISSLC